MDRTEFSEELQRLQANLHITQLKTDRESPDPDNQIQIAQQWKNELKTELRQRETEEKNLFDFGKPIFTYLFYGNEYNHVFIHGIQWGEANQPKIWSVLGQKIMSVSSTGTGGGF
ncbi:hypothetical protein RWE15_23265 [Virgibacillus halophilus]|uniref:Uncharacterized protein n=1 Tax=Tigheibacillus halophilus TaxID=361280 RepID=A0ABU5CBJ1_9BACI|nr:hypothetical protein [Virgibacillus halophilus]